MELKPPAQYYWTTLIDQYQPQSLSFAFVPSRSFPNNQIPTLDIVTEALHAESGAVLVFRAPRVTGNGGFSFKVPRDLVALTSELIR